MMNNNNNNNNNDDERREEGIKRLGSGMLQGWVLTDVPCTLCSIPTMRKKDKSIVSHCVLCNDPQHPWLLSGAAVEETPPEEEDLTFQLNPRDIVELDQIMAEPLEKETISQLLGQKLLAGWTMMQESCPTCLEVIS